MEPPGATELSYLRVAALAASGVGCYICRTAFRLAALCKFVGLSGYFVQRKDAQPHYMDMDV